MPMDGGIAFNIWVMTSSMVQETDRVMSGSDLQRGTFRARRLYVGGL